MAKFRYLLSLEYHDVAYVEADYYSVDDGGRLNFYNSGKLDPVSTVNNNQWIWVDKEPEVKTAEAKPKEDFGFDFSKLNAGLTQEQIDQGFSILQNLFKKG